ncbi:MAG: DNA polymerase ligase N-terminal domain-containing protein [Planctomycetota bacterium]
MPTGSGRADHWDLMLESDGVLRTWELLTLPEGWLRGLPSGDPSAPETVPARQLPDHRLHYLDYQGPISGGRGEVRRVARGPLEWRLLSERELAAELKGDRLVGTVRLTTEKPGSLWGLTLE